MENPHNTRRRIMDNQSIELITRMVLETVQKQEASSENGYVVPNERGTTFNNVQIRVDDSFTLEMHIDTDEANAAKIATGDTVRIIK